MEHSLCQLQVVSCECFAVEYSDVSRQNMKIVALWFITLQFVEIIFFNLYEQFISLSFFNKISFHAFSKYLKVGSMVTLRKHFKPSDSTILLFKDTRPVRHAFQLVLITSFRNESSCEFKILKKVLINERIHNLTRSVANENPEFVHLNEFGLTFPIDRVP